MFEITMLQDTLSVILNYLEPTVGKNSQGLGDDCISMEATATGSCIFYTTNTTECTVIEAVCSNVTQQALAPSVNFKRFKGIISSIPATEYVTIKEVGTELHLYFQMRKTPIVLAAGPTGMLPKPTIVDNIPNDTVDIQMSFFSQAIKKASSIIQESNVSSIYNCVKLTVGNPDVTIEALDALTKRTFVMTEKFGSAVPEVSFLIEANKMQKSLKLFEDFVDIEIGKDNAVTMIKGYNRPAVYNRKHQNASNDIINVIYCLRQISGQFPPVLQYYSAQYQPTEFITVDKEEILNSIARIKAIGDDVSFGSGIAIKVDKKEFTTKFASQNGQLEDSIDVINPITSSFNMIFNHKQFEDVIKTIEADYVDIGQTQGAQGCFIVKGAGSSTTGAYVGTDMFSMLSMAGPQQQTP